MKSKNIKVSVVTEEALYNEGDPSERGWSSITEATGGSLYNIAASGSEFESLMVKMGKDVNTDVNKVISTVDESLDIISSVRKMLNAVVNIVAREVNRLQYSGKTLTGADGGPFFAPLEESIPMEMGNIRISNSAKDLNNLVASRTDANGDNEIALEIAHLRNENLMKGYVRILSVDDYYQNIILRVGNMGRDAEQIAANQQDTCLRRG